MVYFKKYILKCLQIKAMMLFNKLMTFPELLDHCLPLEQQQEEKCFQPLVPITTPCYQMLTFLQFLP